MNRVFHIILRLKLSQIIPEESNLSSKSSFQDSTFIRLTPSRFESTRTIFGNLSKSSFEFSINPSSYDSRIKIHRKKEDIQSKAKAANHHNSSFKTSFKPTDSSCSSEHTSSRNSNILKTRLVNGEPFHFYYDPTFWAFIAMLLFYLCIVKILHLLFDKGRHDLHIFMFK